LAVGIAVVLPDGRRVDVGVRTGPGATVADLTAALADAAGAPALRARPLHVGAGALRPTLAAVDAGIAHGSLVGLGAPAPEATTRVEPTVGATLQVAVVGGAHAGAVIGVAAGATVVVGRSHDADLVLDDGEASRRHLAVTALDDGAAGGDEPVPFAEVEDLGATNGVDLDGHLLDGRTVIVAGTVLGVGASALAVRRSPGAASVLEASPTPGRVALNRPPRIAPPASVRTLVVPVEPDEPPRRRMPLMAALLPLLFGVVIISTIGYSPFLLFVLLSPLMIIGTAVSDRRSGRSDHKRRLGEYHAALAGLDMAVTSAVADDERARRAADPDPAMVITIAGGPTARLWERRPTDPDFLRLRVGLADRPAGITLDRGARRRAAHLGAVDPAAQRPQPVARLVPVSLDVAVAGVVGLAGPRPAALALARATLAGLAALHRPDDVRLAVATGADEADDWAWAGWLPHVGRPAGTGRRLAAGRVEVEALVGELAGLVEERAANRQQLLASGPPPGDKVVLVLDGARRLRAVPGIAGLLADGPEQGVYAVCLDLDEASLPSECRATTVSGPSDAGGAPRWTVRLPDGEVVDDVLADGVDAALADRVARALAPVDDLGGALGRGELPDAVRYLDLVAMADPTATDVLASWDANPGGRSTRALLGVGPDGPLAVDLAADGPHALVAGTTGSGKSELLQTLVASLALANRPDQLQVVLVDYKGGAAFAECAELPHCAGLITDLDGHLVHRALASLTAELKRREGLLAAVGASNLEAFWIARPDTVLPRLVIVIDEFASLVEEVPDFVKGVVGIGMRGRSLGVHVVLATQRPGGVITADLRANVNLRICLRVADPQESTDVVDAPDAARIPTGRPGRAYVRLGPGGRPMAVQAARIGGRRPVPADEESPPDATVDAVCVAVGPGALVPAPRGGGDDEEEGTDLAALVAAVREAATTARIAPPRSPWLAALPDVVLLHDLDLPHAAGGVALGLADLPAEQRRDVLRRPRAHRFAARRGRAPLRAFHRPAHPGGVARRHPWTGGAPPPGDRRWQPGPHRLGGAAAHRRGGGRRRRRARRPPPPRPGRGGDRPPVPLRRRRCGLAGRAPPVRSGAERS
jgi:S-DNA-T family DNA segregation ATPase FtsK/SpoIIIE